MAFRVGPTRLRCYRKPQMKKYQWIIGGIMIAVVLIVLFVPGVAEYIERELLSWLVRVAS